MSPVDSLQRSWYQPGASVPWWTRPIAGLFGVVTRLRRMLYQRGWLRSAQLPPPVIVVGNITAGGAGKTPLVIALVEALRARGVKPGVVSRGYGGDASAPMLLDANPDPTRVGDEPALIRVRTGVAVAVGADRVAAARLLLTEDVDVIVADDGLQHYALARDVEICVIDSMRRFGNAKLLPAGPLREPLTRLDDVDYIVCNGGKPRPNEIPMRLTPGDALALADPACIKALTDFTAQPVHAVAGMANPQRFFATLRGIGIEVIEQRFPDHHRYIRSDLEFGDGLPVLMTEKDAVKCSRFAQPDWWQVPVTAELPATFFDALAVRVRTKTPSKRAE